MSFFTQCLSSRLYAADAGAGWLGYLMPAGGTLPGGIDPGPALATLKGSFLYAAEAPALGDQAAVDAFIAAIDPIIAASVTGRGILWIADPANAAATAQMVGLASDGSQTVGQLTAPVIAGTLAFVLIGGAAVSLSGDALQFQANGVVYFSGARAPGPTEASQVFSATMPLTGPRRGCLVYDIFVQRTALFNSFAWGFHFLAPSNDPVYTTIGFWAPLASGSDPAGSDMLGFAASFDPSDPLNILSNTGVGERPVRSVLVFTGQNGDNSPTRLTSGFATTTGAAVTLLPVGGPVESVPDAARLVFNNGEREPSQLVNFQAVPDGDFVLTTPGAAAGSTDALLCGLHGTEYIGFRPQAGDQQAGDRLRFTSRMASYAATYPFQPSSPVGPPVDADAPLLSPIYTTAWGSMVPAVADDVLAYVAQPKGAPLYGRDPLVHDADKTLLGAVDPALLFPAGVPVPLVPYGLSAPGDGVNGFTSASIEDFEARVIGPVRRALIGAASKTRAASSAAALRQDALGEESVATTPAGLLVTLDGQGAWTKILLGQNLSPTLAQMCFCAPESDLVDAFSTGQLFLVVANATKLGPLKGQGAGDCADAGFYNGINVGDWRFAAEVGQNNHYGDYADIMIVKGRKGPLWDPDHPDESLIVNPEQWTMNQVFAAPSDVAPDKTVGAPNPDELVALAFWLKTYFAAAAAQGDADYFSNFNTIARNRDWTGILFLRMTIAQLPDNLIGIRAGVTAPERFNAHHLGIEISHVANDPGAPIALTNTSSMFGLIYYLDPQFAPPPAGVSPQPVPPDSGGGYDFRLLSLKALFQNSAVQRFQSYAQLGLASLFDMPVDHMGDGGNPYASLVLSGSYQDNGGKAVYGLSTTGPASFYFANNLFNKIEIDAAQMSTRDTGAQSGTVTSWFALSGFLDFAIAEARGTGDDRAFDLLSFGSPADAPATPRQGLAFSNLGLEMSFALPSPGQPVFETDFTFVTSEIRFDVGTSTPRAGSLYTDFALGLQGLTGGAGDASPQSMGFLPVITDATLNDPAGGTWYGLSYQLDLGTPGALAGDLGLKASLLTAWAPVSAGTDSYAGLVAIKLPGAGTGGKLISLQNVLKLSIGQLRLIRTGKPAKSFLLMLTDIALRFLGLLKIPPSGSSLFYLFGNPDNAGKPSGLGWYASYRQPTTARDAEAPRARSALPADSTSSSEEAHQ